MPADERTTTPIGIVGSGFVATGFARLLSYAAPELALASVLSRRPPESLPEPLRQARITASLDDFLAHSALIVECSGDIRHATVVIEAALAAGLPVVTMHSEWHVTVGSCLAARGWLSEAEGDQPGSLAALREDMLQMGFTPWIYGNIKGFLNHTPSPAEMDHWSTRQGISRAQTTSFTDGTKLQFEQALVANGLGAGILQTGLAGPPAELLNPAAEALAQRAYELGAPIADYLLAPALPPGVFITARHHPEDQAALTYLKLGPGPFYTLYRPFHLCQYEMLKTVRRALQGQPPLLNNGPAAKIGVRAVAKRQLVAGERIAQAIGSFELRGEAVRCSDDPEHVPMGLLQDAVLCQSLDPGQPVRFSDVELPESRALELFWSHKVKP
ncbi:MAG TPA: hypothetical protein V6D23_12830 [Candidatus Obscuribacterales bacterium]